MSTVTHKTIAQIIHEYTIPLPSVPAELSRLLAAAHVRAIEMGMDVSCDDWCEVTADTDHLTLRISK